jgi:hypothetical protein
MAESLGCLLVLSKEQILPIELPFNEKIAEIMAFLSTEANRALTGTD